MKRVLIANRGEIAVRLIRGCRDLGLETVAIYADCDRESLHVRLADVALGLEGNAPTETYLRIDRIVELAKTAAADAVHPGYGFLAENAAFAAAVSEAGLTYVGPSAEAIALMGSKTEARGVARRAGVPVVPGTDGPLDEGLSDRALAAEAERIGYPLLVKAVAGGGGKGMRAVVDPSGLLPAIRAARSEAASAFGDAAVYLERRLARPRHVEIQLLGDTHGIIVPFVERECSIQRRHQKVVEESPSPRLNRSVREAMADAATRVAAEVGYSSAGTIEFLIDADDRFYFLEMNTRLQVEHPVTELVTGIDLVEWQLRIARGEALTVDPAAALTPRGHAVECRVYAEDPDQGFMPSPGRILGFRPPGGPGVRDDSGVETGFDVPRFYDSMIAKLIVWGADRRQALARLRRAMAEYEVHGIKTTLPFFRWLIDQPAFASGEFDTRYLDRVLDERRHEPFAPASADDERLATIAVALHGYLKASRAAASANAGTGRAHGSRWRVEARAQALRPR